MDNMWPPAAISNWFRTWPSRAVTRFTANLSGPTVNHRLFVWLTQNPSGFLFDSVSISSWCHGNNYYKANQKKWWRFVSVFLSVLVRELCFVLVWGMCRLSSSSPQGQYSSQVSIEQQSDGKRTLFCIGYMKVLECVSNSLVASCRRANSQGELDRTLSCDLGNTRRRDSLDFFRLYTLRRLSLLNRELTFCLNGGEKKPESLKSIRRGGNRFSFFQLKENDRKPYKPAFRYVNMKTRFFRGRIFHCTRMCLT